jgi:PAS domain S-box-containing protein
VEGNAPDAAEIERLLRQARSEWTATVDTVSDLIVLEDSNGCVLRCNLATATFFATGFADLIGKPLVGLFFPGQSLAELPRCLRDELAVLQFPGRAEWYEVTNYPMAIRLERGASWVHILKDITARRIAEGMTQRLTVAISQAVEAIVILDPKGVIEYANPALTAISGLPEAEALGRPLQLLPLGPTDRKIHRTIVRTLALGHVWQGAYGARRRDGTSYEEEATISPVRDSEGRILSFVAVCRDVTERKRLEAIAEAVNAMDNVGYVFSSLRHELGNPINSIKTALAVLRKNLDHYPMATITEYLDRTLAEVGRVEYLLKVLRTFNMYENPRAERGDVRRFLDDFCGLIRTDFEAKGITVLTAFELQLGEALFDPRALHQVLLNLVTNAADALAQRFDPRLTICAKATPRAAVITVVDNGFGMTTEQQANLFRPFYTAKLKGTGLGLVIVKKLVTGMGGTVSVASRSGAGTEVTVTLPAVAPENEHSA